MASERIVIVGGTSGIGLGVAKLFARRGAEVILGSHRESSMDAAQAELDGLDARGQLVDVTSEDSVSGFLGGVGEIDHLIYTAGAALDLMPVTEIDMEVARHYHDVRCFGILVVAKHAAARIRPGGSIVLTSGIAGARPSPGWAVASGTAGTIEAYARALAVELAPVRVNAVSPGTVRSPLWSGMPEAERRPTTNTPPRRISRGRSATHTRSRPATRSSPTSPSRPGQCCSSMAADCSYE